MQKRQAIYTSVYAWLCLTTIFLPCAIAVANAQSSFRIIVLPDTQNYVDVESDGSAPNAGLFTQQTQYIASQIQAGNPDNIQFVTHLGDVVSNGDDPQQYLLADASLDVLDGVVPYSVLPGNHDYNDTNDKTSGNQNYINTFGPSRFAGKSFFGGADPSGNNTYQTFNAGGFDFIYLALEWIPAQNTPLRQTSSIEWAQSVIDSNPGTPVILSTHDYIDDGPAGRSGAGNALFDQLVSNNDEIFLVLGGHNHSLPITSGNDGEYHQVSTNNAGRPVFEVLQNFQDYPNGGDGWLRFIDFDVANDRIEFQTFSPVLNQFQTETVAQVGGFASQFEFNVDFSDRLTPVDLPSMPTPDLIFQEGVNGYTGTLDKGILGVGGDTGNGGDVVFDVDASSSGSPTQALIRFENIIGTGSGQIAPSDSIDQALLVLEIEGSGSGFQLHELLTTWDEDTTYAGLVGGIQADGVEAAVTPVASIGANNSDRNVLSNDAIEIDVTSTIQAYLDGTLTNLGWALLPFLNGTNGLDIHSSEELALDLRPSLQIFLVDTTPGDFDGDGDVDGNDFLQWQLTDGTTSALADLLANYGTSTSSLASFEVVPEPSTFALFACIAPCILSRRRRGRTPSF